MQQGGCPPCPQTLGFKCLEDAREWVAAFVVWYNEVHRHSAIRLVTPAPRHRGEDVAILAQRNALNVAAKTENPARWSGSTRKWSPVGAVVLNPDKEACETIKIPA